MSVSWVSIGAGVIADGKAIRRTLLADLDTRDRSNVERPFNLSVPETGQSGVVHPTFASLGTNLERPIYVPEFAGALKLVLWLKVTAGTGTVKALLGSVSSDEQTTASTTFVLVTLTFSDVTTLRKTKVNLDIQVSNTGSGNTTSAKIEDLCAARWESV